MCHKLPATASPILKSTSKPSQMSSTPKPVSPASPVSTPSPLPLSTPSPSPLSTPSRTICLSGENLVEVKDYGYIPMSKVKIGDFEKSGNDLYSQIYGFGHFDHDQEATYLHFAFDSNDKNRVSQNVFVDNVNNKPRFIRASDVVVGDILSGKRIKSIETVACRGVYAPLTQSGDIIVNGILSSNYVDVLKYRIPMNQHKIGHLMFTPQRWFCYYCMGSCKKEIYVNGYGILAYLVVIISSIINGFQCIIRVCLRF